MAGTSWRLFSTHVARRILSPGCVVAHMGAFLVIGTILVLANAIGSPGQLWFWRPLLVLGALLALHAGLTAASRTSLLQVAGNRSDSARSGLSVRRLRQTVTGAFAAPADTPPGRQEAPRWQPVAGPTQQPPAAVSFPAQPRAWSDPEASVTGHGWWPSAGPTDRTITHSTPHTPESVPVWAASWPSLPATNASVRIQPTGTDTVLNGAQSASPDAPRWDQLEVAATTWLAQRAGESRTADAVH